MKIALITRHDAASAPGGDIDQAEALAAALVKEGHEADLVSEQGLDLKGTDLAVIFNLTRPEDAYRQAKACIRQQVPYALFPIYWNHDRAIPARAYPGGALRAIFHALPAFLRDPIMSFRFHRRDRVHRACKPNEALPLILNRHKLNAFTLREARAICVMAQKEISHLKSEFSVLEKRDDFILAPNGIWTRNLPPPEDKHRHKRIVFAGAFGPRKNQLNLIRSARGLDAEVLILGYATSGEAVYEKMMRREAPPNVRFVARQSREAYLATLNGSWVYAQPSYFELPGISALEAAALGCQMVLVDAGTVREYFQEEALYADPADPDDIRQRLQQALEKPAPNRILAERVRKEYDLERCLVPFAKKLGDHTCLK